MLELNEFEEVNYEELACIFAESGSDRELDFDYEQAVQDIYDLGPGAYNTLRYEENP